ncbi:MAG: hypothetical protein M0R51_10130 [Clostridia bacterium]|jgi:hypothetical protein|nr:hypothetical protein [Clostridia bacterium]
MENEATNKRTRMNASLTAKGLVQWDITAEYDTPELTAEMLGKAIDLERKVIKDKGLEEVKATDK